MMYGHEKSDPAIVAVKPTRKCGDVRDHGESWGINRPAARQAQYRSP